MGILKAMLVILRAMLIPKVHMFIENLALRQQLAVCRQIVKRPKLRPRDRVFWAGVSMFWRNWQSALIIVQPETVIRWHRQGFRLYWRWKSGADKLGHAYPIRDSRLDSAYVPRRSDVGRTQNLFRTASVKLPTRSHWLTNGSNARYNSGAFGLSIKRHNHARGKLWVFCSTHVFWLVS